MTPEREARDHHLVIPEADRLHVTLSGGGDPYSVLDPLGRRLAFALNAGVRRTELARVLSVPERAVDTKLAALVEASLVAETEGGPTPTFFIADAGAVRAARPLAGEAASRLAETVLRHREDLEHAHAALACCRDASLRQTGFILVGDLALDVGLLMALWRDATLLPPPPRRPSPNWPDAAYHCWMVEGSPDDLSRYGHRSLSLPWRRWELITFGRYELADGAPNAARSEFHRGALSAAAAESGPDTLAARLRVLLIEGDDVSEWMKVVSRIGLELIRVYSGFEPAMRAMFGRIRASRYAHAGFAEFFCWLDHLAYAEAIDILARADLFEIPREQFAAAIVDGASLWRNAPAR